MEVFKNDECVVCLEENSVSVFQPCGHQCCCVKCMANVYGTKTPCPLCEKKIDSVLFSIHPKDKDYNITDVPSKVFVEYFEKRRDAYTAKLREEVEKLKK
jgi:predicted amidophosphoribosyltransferase